MLRIALVGMTFVLSGCFSTSRHGDAKVKLVAEPFVLKSKNRTILLPEFSISEVGDHRIDVAELPVPMYPTVVAIPAGEFYHTGISHGVTPPWTGAVVRIRFINPEGVTLLDEVSSSVVYE